MGRINWGRIVLCGIVAGSVYSILAVAIFFFVLNDTEFWQADLAGYRRVPWAWVSNFALNLVAGIWTMWLYACVRPRYGPGPKSAAVAGAAAWLLIALFAVQLASVQLTAIPLRAFVVPLAVLLPVRVVASVVGAWQYKE